MSQNDAEHKITEEQNISDKPLCMKCNRKRTKRVKVSLSQETIETTSTCPMRPTRPAVNACNLSTLNVSPCSGDTVYFHSEVAAAPIGTSSFSVVKAADNPAVLTNITLVIEPKGTGALTTTEPNGTIPGGIQRGTNAVDLQMKRSQAAQVASGPSSVITGGSGNTAAGNLSVNCAGLNNSTAGAVSSNVGGEGNIVLNNYGSNLGGRNNINSGEYGTNGGGQNNNVSGSGAVNAGGAQNLSSALRSVCGGGQGNKSTNNFAVVSGGQGNESSGQNSVCPGGRGNISGGQNSFAGGSDAEALFDDSFVWSVTQQPLIKTRTTAVKQVVYNLRDGVYLVPPLTETYIVNGDLFIEGTITSTSNSFLINHPILENKRLRHKSVESSKSDLIYRGQVTLVYGKAEVDIDTIFGMTPGTFSKLTKNHQAHLTNTTKNNWDQVKIEDYDVLPTGKFYIISNKDESNVVVDWLIITERVTEEVELATEIEK